MCRAQIDGATGRSLARYTLSARSADRKEIFTHFLKGEREREAWATGGERSCLTFCEAFSVEFRVGGRLVRGGGSGSAAAAVFYAHPPAKALGNETFFLFL